MPGFDSIVLEESGESVRMLKARFQNAKDASKLHRYSFRQLSDGQRALVALYSLIFLADNHKTSLFIDEPDNYLALREVQPWVVSASEKCGETLEQATFISHHPVLIDYLGVEKGKWFTRSPEGPARVSNESKVTEGLSLSETVARGWE